MALETGKHALEVQTILVDGRLDALRATDLRSELSGIVDSGVYRIIVDLSATTFVDSAGLAALAKGMKDCRSKGGDLRLVEATEADAARVFALTRFDQVFTMGASVDELLASW